MTDMLCLNIRQEYAKLDIRTTNITLQLRNASQKAEMDANSEAAVLEVNREKGSFDIDSTASRYAKGMKNVMDFSRDNAAAGMRNIQEFTARIVDNGTQMALGVGDRIIAEVAHSNLLADKEPYRITLEHIPKPEVTYTEDKLYISYRMGNPNVTVQPVKVENITQLGGSVDISLAQRESIRMWTTVGKYDIYS